MTDQEKNIAVAEKCGWIRHCGWWESPQGLPRLTPPDYGTDMNACREMEESVPPNLRVAYMDHLDRITKDPGLGWHSCHAKPAQRREAFLRTFNLWKDP